MPTPVYDRNHGKLYSQQVEDIHKNLTDFVSSVEREITDRQRMIELLEQSEIFYDVQYGEAKIVANAYKNFGTRISNLRKRLDDVKKTLPDPLSPVPSPTLDAPSPAESPVDTTLDNTDAVDMELSDGHEEPYSPDGAGIDTSLHSSEDTTAEEAATYTPSTTNLPSVASSGAIVTSAAEVAVSSSITAISSVSLLIDSGLPKFDANSVLSLLSSLKSQPVEPAESSTKTAYDPAAVVEPAIQADKNRLPVTENMKSTSGAAEQYSIRSPVYEPVAVNEAVKRDCCQIPAFETSLMSEPVKLDSVVRSVAQVSDVFGEGKQHDALPDFGISAKFVTVKPDHVVSVYRAPQPIDVERGTVAAPAYATTSLAVEPFVMTPVYMTSEPQQSDSALSPTYMDADDDAGGLTPVLDEKPETTEIPISPPPASSVAGFVSAARPAAATEESVIPPTTRVTDPIAFLNQMLSQSKPKQTGSSASFLQSLSLLTKSIPSNKHSGVDSDSDGANDDVYVGGYLDTASAAVDNNKLKTQSAMFGSWTTTPTDDEPRPPLPRSPSPILPPPPLPQMIVTSAASPPELPPPPPLPPSLCSVTGFLDIAQCTSQALLSLNASAPIVAPGPPLSTQLSSGLPQSAHQMPGATESVIPPLTIQTGATAAVRYADIPAAQTSAPRPPPPPPPPAYPASGHLPPSGPRQDWRGMSPRRDSAAAPVDGRLVSATDSQVVTSTSSYHRHQGLGIGVCDEPRYVNVDRDQRSSNVDFSGPAGDTHEFAERLKRKTSMQFSPGAHEALEPFHSANASVIYADRHASVYNTDYSRCDSLTADDASKFKSGGNQNSNVRPRNDVSDIHRNTEPAWSSDSHMRRDAPMQGTCSPPVSPSGMGFRSEPRQHIPSDFQFQPRPNRLPPPSLFSLQRGPVPSRFPRGHYTRF